MRCLILFLVLFPASLHAQSITELKQGQEAPFDGILLSIDAYAELVSEEEYRLKVLTLEHDSEISKLKAKYNLDISNLKVDLNTEKKIRKIEYDSNQRYITFLETKAINKNNFLEEYDFNIGIVVGVGAAILTFFVVDAIEDKIEKNE